MPERTPSAPKTTSMHTSGVVRHAKVMSHALMHSPGVAACFAPAAQSEETEAGGNQRGIFSIASALWHGGARLRASPCARTHTVNEVLALVCGTVPNLLPRHRIQRAKMSSPSAPLLSTKQNVQGMRKTEALLPRPRQLSARWPSHISHCRHARIVRRPARACSGRSAPTVRDRRVARCNGAGAAGKR